MLARHLSLPIYTRPTDVAKEGAATSESQSQSTSFRLLAVLTLSASFALSTPFTASQTTALGISSVIFAAVGFVLLEQAIKSTASDEVSHKSPQIIANGTASREKISDAPTKTQQLVALRDVAAVLALLCGLAAYFMEPRLGSEMVSWEPVYRFGGGTVKSVRHYRTMQLVMVFIVVNVFVNVLTFLMVRRLFYLVALSLANGMAFSLCFNALSELRWLLMRYRCMDICSFTVGKNNPSRKSLY